MPLFGMPCWGGRGARALVSRSVNLGGGGNFGGEGVCAYILHNHVVGRYSICGYEEEGGRVDFIEISDLAGGEEGEGSLDV